MVLGARVEKSWRIVTSATEETIGRGRRMCGLHGRPAMVSRAHKRPLLRHARGAHFNAALSYRRASPARILVLAGTSVSLVTTAMRSTLGKRYVTFPSP